MVRRLKKALFAAAGVLLGANLISSSAPAVYPQSFFPQASETAAVENKIETPNLVEQVSGHYRGRYKLWKSTFLSEPSGRQLWLKYAASSEFHLTIIVSKDQGKGAKVKDYRWEAGKLVAATIMLGSQLNSGYPGQQYYPVLGSLAFTRYPWEERSDFVLAAAKIAHEFGHIDHTASSDAGDYQLRNELLDVYATKFKSNGYDPDDPALAELTTRLGGDPDEIHGQREYWAETYAMRYLLEKLGSWERHQLLRLVRKTLQSSDIYSLPSQCEWTTLASPDHQSDSATCSQLTSAK
jgi:hypothetical protein